MARTEIVTITNMCMVYNENDVTIQNLINWGVVKNMDGTLVPTNVFVLLTDNIFPFAKIQCALFIGMN